MVFGPMLVRYIRNQFSVLTLITYVIHWSDKTAQGNVTGGRMRVIVAETPIVNV